MVSSIRLLIDYFYLFVGDVFGVEYSAVNLLFLSVCSDVCGIEYSAVNLLFLSVCSDVSGVEYSDADVNRL